MTEARKKYSRTSKGDGSVKDNARSMSPIEENIQVGLAEALSRTVFLRDMTIVDIQKIMPHWRTGHLASLRAMKMDEFGTWKLSYAAEKLGVTPICHFVPAMARSGYDGDFAELFNILHAAGEACGKALPEIGQRTYPLAWVACESARLSCHLAIEGIRRNRHFADREAEDFTLQLVSASRLLNRITHKTIRIRSAISKLEEACDALDEFSEGQVNQAKPHISDEPHAAAR